MEIMKLLRIKQGKRQIDVANEVGVSLATYRRWEYGQTEPSFSQLRKLAGVFGLEHAKFFRFLEVGSLK